MPKVHPPTDRDAATIATVRFDIALFIGRGKYAHASARTLAEARNEAAPALEAEHPYGRRALIYAVDADGRSALVTDDIFNRKPGELNEDLCQEVQRPAGRQGRWSRSQRNRNREGEGRLHVVLEAAAEAR
jgi:hypothetical protein